MSLGPIATPPHESYTCGNAERRPLPGPPLRLARCGKALLAQGVSLRLEINPNLMVEAGIHDSLDRFSKLDLLILDNFFTISVGNSLNAIDLFEILEAREEERQRCSTPSSSPTSVPAEQLRTVRRLQTEPRHRARQGTRHQGTEHVRARCRLKAEADKGHWDR